MRIAAAAFMHESNTFIASPTTLDDYMIQRGPALVDYYGETFHEVGGFIQGASDFGFELIPLLAANATPKGALTADTYETILGEILDQIRAEQPNLDGILLALHGAMVAEGFPQADGETVRRVRELVGPGFPLVVTHDYHGNVPPQLVEDATALIIYKTCPHIDQRERGIQAAELITRTIRGEINPVSAIIKPELVFNIMFHNTAAPPMQPLMDAAIALEERPDIIATSIAAGYQYADVPWMGPSIVVVADGDQALAEQEAGHLGQMMWDAREQLILDVPNAKTAVRMAMDSEVTPVALFEVGDNIGGGSAGDATILLEELLAQKVDGWVVALYDPEAVQRCVEADVGGTVDLSVGGKTDDQHGPTLAVSGTIQNLHDGKYEETERRHGGARYIDQGQTAVVAVGKGLLILNSQRTTPFSIHQLTSVGIVPEEQKILVAKGTVAPRAAYEPVCPRIIEVDTDGATAINRSADEYRLAREGLYEWARGE